MGETQAHKAEGRSFVPPLVATPLPSSDLYLAWPRGFQPDCQYLWRGGFTWNPKFGEEGGVILPQTLSWGRGGGGGHNVPTKRVPLRC